jgi:hypothetical protein
MRFPKNGRCCLSRPGTVIIWLVLAMTAIVGVVALGLDGGRIMDERRHAQAVADAAALAAAADLYRNYWTQHGQDPVGTARDAALNCAAANNYANDGTNTTVTVNVPPRSGTYAGQAGYVEVLAERKIRASFAKIFTFQDLQVQARAVAIGQPVKIGLLLLRPGGAGAFLNQALAFTAVNSSIIVNSNDPAAFNQASPGVVLAKRYDITGNYVNSGGGTILGRIHTRVRPTPDLLSFLPVPDSAPAPVRSMTPTAVNSPLPTVLQPGVYKGGIQISGSSVVTMLPGVYIMEGGGFQVDEFATVAGLEVTVYNTNGSYPAGPILINSLGRVALAAPLTGPYQGISFFQNRSHSQPLSITGYGQTVIAGVIYAAQAPVELTGSAAAGVDTLGGAFVCDSMRVQGAGGTNVDLGLNPPRVPEVHVVE